MRISHPLAISVVSWESSDGTRHTARCAAASSPSSPARHRHSDAQAVQGDDLATLDKTVLNRFRADIETDGRNMSRAPACKLNAIRQIMRHLRPGGRVGPGIFI